MLNVTNLSMKYSKRNSFFKEPQETTQRKLCTTFSNAYKLEMLTPGALWATQTRISFIGEARAASSMRPAKPAFSQDHTLRAVGPMQVCQVPTVHSPLLVINPTTQTHEMNRWGCCCDELGGEQRTFLQPVEGLPDRRNCFWLWTNCNCFQKSNLFIFCEAWDVIFIGSFRQMGRKHCRPSCLWATWWVPGFAGEPSTQRLADPHHLAPVPQRTTYHRCKEEPV